MTRTDFIILFAIMLVYGIFALHDLGYNSAPETGWEGTKAGQQIVLDFGEVKNLKEVRKYLDEAGADVSGMSDEELKEACEVFALPSGGFLIVEG